MRKGEDREGEKRGQGTLKIVVSAQQFCQPEPAENKDTDLGALRPDTCVGACGPEKPRPHCLRCKVTTYSCGA